MPCAALVSLHLTYSTALVLTLLVEVPAVALLYPRQRWRMALTCLVTTSATHLAMHFWLRRLIPAWSSWLVTGELMALLVEASVYALAARPRDLPRALVASALANSLSLGLGLLLTT